MPVPPTTGGAQPTPTGVVECHGAVGGCSRGQRGDGFGGVNASPDFFDHLERRWDVRPGLTPPRCQKKEGGGGAAWARTVSCVLDPHLLAVLPPPVTAFSRRTLQSPPQSCIVVAPLKHCMGTWGTHPPPP